MDIIGEAVFSLDDKELVKATQRVDHNYNTREIAKAELVRRQMDAIRRFDEVSSCWSKRIFWLSVSVGVLVFFQLVLMFLQLKG